MFLDFGWNGAGAARPALEVLQRQPAEGAATRRTPVVFVHGAFVGAWCWAEHFLDHFAAQGFHGVAPSLRGHGGSEGAGQLQYAGINEFVADLERVVAGLDGPPPVLVGHSMGGLVVQRYLERYPATAAVLMASVPPSGLLPSTWRMLMSDPLLFAQFGLMQGLGPRAVDLDVARRAVFSDHLPEPDLARYARYMQPESQRAIWEMSATAPARPWRVDQAPPMLVLGAEDDALFSVPEAEATARLWQADLAIVPGMAHAMMLEPGWDGVADRLVKWLWARGVR
ncbi:alpha/beta hydrolase [Spiribacter halobius]|uniref:Alpha/beta hydrolase n=1 Tax=Sediminicurvatus halobius TaxID=2182432 RepID=A0A2U2N4C2_9GAMM|nr:alpha/beta hydrolase [Spiribacter halobius]PWG63942.1 alpha/beta hydrolase [Spiribacter halobius]UEX76357.1 alpha/beta hydrolase [Spiribacter halobius]